MTQPPITNSSTASAPLSDRILILKSALVGQLKQKSFVLDHLEVIRLEDAIRIIQKQRIWQHGEHCRELPEFDGFSCCGPECAEEQKQAKVFRRLKALLRNKPDLQWLEFRARIQRNLKTVNIEGMQIVEPGNEMGDQQ